tara:strand:- start:604 stop:876 length:273 start_codon:yes stop_codon:yes gene_type:complete
MKVKGDIWTSIAVFLGAIICFSFGLWMIINDKVGIGTHRLTQQPTGSGGELLILIGILFLVVTYFTLHPFSLIRKFIDNLFSRKKRKTKK